MTLLSEQLADGPLAAWPMDETSGTVMYDASGNGRDGEYVGGVTLGAAGIAAAGVRSVSFPGVVTAHAKVTYDSAWMDPAAEFTIEAMVQASSLTPATYSGIFGQYTSAGFTGMAALGIFHDATLYGEAWGVGGPQPAFTSQPAVSPVTDPYLFTFRRTASTLQVFKNGVLFATTAANGVPGYFAHDFVIGMMASNGAFPWNGRISHVAYYDTALATPSIEAHAGAAAVTYINLAPSPGGVLTAATAPRGRVKLGLVSSIDGGPP